MSLVFYRKYRPQNFSEVAGQDHVVQTLQGALALNRVAHAYLFAGPRGTGKTTVARLLAKYSNCLEIPARLLKKERSVHLNTKPCEKCYSCAALNKGNALDVIEIDAASNRGIDEIRNLKESVRFMPQGGRYKFYIIDEAHMLTKEASNALLKMLEEPPEHVIFILATTEKAKILPTILSRVQTFDFHNISARDIIKKLKYIVKKEEIKIEPRSLELVALSAEGSLRDAESNLAKVASFTGDAITHEDVQNILGIIPIEKHHTFFHLLADANQSKALDFIEQAYSSGVDLGLFSESFVRYLRALLVLNLHPARLVAYQKVQGDYQAKLMSEQAKTVNSAFLMEAIKKFLEAHDFMKTTPIPQLPLELAAIELIRDASPISPT